MKYLKEITVITDIDDMGLTEDMTVSGLKEGSDWMSGNLSLVTKELIPGILYPLRVYILIQLILLKSMFQLHWNR